MAYKNKPDLCYLWQALFVRHSVFVLDGLPMPYSYGNNGLPYQGGIAKNQAVMVSFDKLSLKSHSKNENGYPKK
jgi:hypothetical protein